MSGTAVIDWLSFTFDGFSDGKVDSLVRTWLREWLQSPMVGEGGNGLYGFEHSVTFSTMADDLVRGELVPVAVMAWGGERQRGRIYVSINGSGCSMVKDWPCVFRILESMKARIKGASSTAANGVFITPATVTAAGKQVTMPASATIAANAASFAVSAVRLNPAGLVIGLTAQWLLSEGLQYLNGEWRKSVTTAAFRWWNQTGQNFIFATPVEVADARCAGNGGPWSGNPAGWQTNGGAVYCTNGTQFFIQKICWNNTQAFDQGCSAPPAGTDPAVEQDFIDAAADPIPDAVAQELARANVPIPVAEPVLSPTPIVEPYGSPFVDPVTGKTLQTKTRITPDPIPGDPFHVRIESYNVEVAPAPAPVPGDDVPAPKDEQPTDPCLDNPNRVGCLDAGEPEDVELGTLEVPFSVTPIAIGGSGACPPNPTFQAAGQTFVINYGPMCDAAIWLKPIILAMAWLSAAMIISGAVRES